MSELNERVWAVMSPHGTVAGELTYAEAHAYQHRQPDREALVVVSNEVVLRAEKVRCDLDKDGSLDVSLDIYKGTK